jgi:phage baseplate assembly protein gpV
MSRIGGVVPGTVKSLDDPRQLGRVQVSFDWMDGAPESFWARVAAPMAGAGRGAFFMPEVSDEVLVAFDHGEVSHPYVIGYCWSAPDKPPFDAALKKRGIKTVSGHELIFDDDAKSITLTTQAGFKLVLDEQGSTITLSTAQGVAITLEDVPPTARIDLPTGNSIALGPSGLEIDAPAGTVDVTTLSATITAPSVMLDSAIVSVTGVLNVTGPIITAGGIISPVYTPGVGNLI